MVRYGARTPPRILVAEDNFLMAEVICDFVRSCGLEPVGPAGTVEAGLLLAQDETIDAAVLDINLHGRMCFPICSALAERHIPFVFLSGYASLPMVPHEFRATRHVEKPFVPDELEAVLVNLVSGRANGHNQRRQAAL